MSESVERLTPREYLVLRENATALQLLLTAIRPLFQVKAWDVAGEDDTAFITIKYEDWEHLLFIAEPFFPKEIAAINERLSPPPPKSYPK